MSDKKVSALTELTTVADGDLLYIVDVSDTSGGSSGTSKKAQAKNARGWPQTSAESSAGVTPTNYQYSPGNVLRYGTNTTPGTTDMTTAIQNALNANTVITIPSGIYLCYGLSATNNTIISDNATLKQASGQESSSVLTLNGASRIEGSLNIDLNTGVRASDVVSVDGTDTSIEYLYIHNGTNDAGGYYAVSINSGNFYAGTIKTNAAGYAGVSIDTTADIDRVVIDYLESIDFFYKGFRCNGDVEELVIGKMVAKSSYTNSGMDGFLIDTGASGNEVQSLRLGTFVTDGATANNMKLSTGTIDVDIGSIFINNAQPGTEVTCITLETGNHINIGSISINGATATYLLSVLSGVSDLRVGSYYSNTTSDVYALRFTGGASGVINAHFGAIFVENNTKTNGFIRVDGFSGQELNCTIGTFYSSADQRPINVSALPANAGAITIENMIGYTGSSWTGATVNNRVLSLPKPRKGLYLTAAPTAGTYVVGDMAWNASPSAGGNLGWVCVSAGTPGTWVPFGGIEAGSAYTPTNVTTDRAFDADTVAVAELADVVGTLIADLQGQGILS